jgi:hypothetical protein
MKKNLIFVLVLVLLVSGCASQDALFSGYDAEIQTESADIISISSPKIIPSLIYNRDTFDINFEIENIHETRDARNMEVSIDNWNPCEITSINSVPLASLDWDKTSYYPGLRKRISSDDYKRDLSSGAVAPVSLTMKAKTPTDDLPGVCNIIYRVNYAFDAVTTFNGISLMSVDAYRTLLRSGETPVERPIEHVGVGPVKIFFETNAKFPIESTEGRTFTMFMTIENQGSGTFGDSGQIGMGKIFLKIPKDLILTNEPCDMFSDYMPSDDETQIPLGEEGDHAIFTNNEAIPMIEGKSTKIKCTLNAYPDGDNKINYEKTYYMTANYSYGYEVRDTIEIDIVQGE